MSQYLVLSPIDIQNANSIAGLTWGFPAITHFLGFTHALSRKISTVYDGEYNFEFSGCGIVSHSIQNKVYQPKKYADFEFLQSKNPPVLAKSKSSSPPIIEEGKMNLTVSLVLEIDRPVSLTKEKIQAFEEHILTLCLHMRVAGGTVLNIEQAKLFSASTPNQHMEMLRKIKRLTMPGFVLIDRTDYLQKHYQSLLDQHEKESPSADKPQLLDAWLDFSALRFRAVPELTDEQTEPDENTPANWEHVPKPNSGYLVPLMTGYKAISELYGPGEVLNTRDETTPSRYVEAIHSVGEWQGMHRVKDISSVIWRYHHDDQWYICQQNGNTSKQSNEDTDMAELENIQTTDLNNALNLF